MYHYELRNGSYYLLGDEINRLTNDHEILSMSDEVAICFSMDNGMTCLHKHGSPEKVNKWYEETRKKYIAHGLRHEADSLLIISGKFPVEELNKMLDITGYIGSFVKKHFPPVV